MLQDSFAHAADDMAARALAEAQVEADQIAAATRAALAADGDLLSRRRARARSTPRSPMLARCRDGADHRALVAAIDALNHATERVRRAAHGPQRRARAHRAAASTR